MGGGRESARRRSISALSDVRSQLIYSLVHNCSLTSVRAVTSLLEDTSELETDAAKRREGCVAVVLGCIKVTQYLRGGAGSVSETESFGLLVVALLVGLCVVKLVTKMVRHRRKDV